MLFCDAVVLQTCYFQLVPHVSASRDAAITRCRYHAMPLHAMPLRIVYKTFFGIQLFFVCNKLKTFIIQIKARFHYERGKKHFLFVLLIFFCVRFNRRSIKERKNAFFHARSGNGPLNKNIF